MLFLIVWNWSRFIVILGSNVKEVDLKCFFPSLLLRLHKKRLCDSCVLIKICLILSQLVCFHTCLLFLLV